MALNIYARLNARPEAVADGSSVIAHDISTLWVDDIGENPYIHKTVDIPVSIFQAIAALPVNQRVAAYIAAIRQFFFAQRVPLQQPNKPGAFDDDSLLAYIAAYSAWEAEFDGNNEDCGIWAANATAFVEGLEAFKGWDVEPPTAPIAFTLYSE